MQNRGQLYWGLAIILLGVLFLIGNLTNIDIGAFCWPAALILVGMWFILRPRMTGPDTVDTTKIIGDIDRGGPWTVSSEDFTGFVMDVDLDMTGADIPLGQTRLRLHGFVTELDMFVPADVGVRVDSVAFVTETKINGEKAEHFFSSGPVQTLNFEGAGRQIIVEPRSFVAEVSVRQVAAKG
ncbi:MAG: hypothetical protein KC418_04675 [Anaerolineales bacterium]|nr:hypothetical protein [Anaerolineales bacterium]MCB8952221.1 hypothetical protein [Ardenticatenales bacterium]